MVYDRDLVDMLQWSSYNVFAHFTLKDITVNRFIFAIFWSKRKFAKINCLESVHINTSILYIVLA